METNEEHSEEAVKKFLRRHWKMAGILIGVIAVAVIVSVYVFFRVAADLQTQGLVPLTLGQWTVGYFIGFMFHVILWEVVFVVSWVIPIVVVIFALWYRKLPDEERKEYGLSPKRGTDPRRIEGGGFFSFWIGVVWLIVVWFTGRWNLAFQNWTFNELIYSWFAACLWALLPLVIAGTIYLIWWLRKEMKKES